MKNGFSDFLPDFSLYLKKNVGPGSFARLIKAFHSAEAVYASTASKIKEICPRLTEATINEILKGPDFSKVYRQIEKCQKLGVKIVRWDAPDYPRGLNLIQGFPPFLFVKGKWPISQCCIGIVGTRLPTGLGVKVAERMTTHLVHQGLGILSGLARGIDATAHRAALKAGGHTVAVLGCGLDSVYPKENSDLFHTIAQRGTLITEFPLGVLPEPKNFPLRNRIISGLSQGVLVVEAGIKSGALITCEHAKRQSKPIFAVPGSVFSRMSDGPNHLIQQGAYLIMHPDDILQILESPNFHQLKSVKDHSRVKHQKSSFLNLEPAEPKRTSRKLSQKQIDPLPEEEKKILTLLDQKEFNVETLSELSGSAPHSLIFILLNLEMKGLITRKPGSVYCQNI